MSTPPPYPSRIFGSAEISVCGQYRYELTRSWDSTKPAIAFVMLNPSTADAAEDDPTIRKCIGFANRWGYGELRVYNLFNFRATDPLLLPADAFEARGLKATEFAARVIDSHVVVCAWGSTPVAKRNPMDFARIYCKTMWSLHLDRLFALQINQDGNPRHPLYVRNDQPLIPFTIPPDVEPQSCLACQRVMVRDGDHWKCMNCGQEAPL